MLHFLSAGPCARSKERILLSRSLSNWALLVKLHKLLLTGSANPMCQRAGTGSPEDRLPCHAEIIMAAETNPVSFVSLTSIHFPDLLFRTIWCNCVQVWFIHGFQFIVTGETREFYFSSLVKGTCLTIRASAEEFRLKCDFENTVLELWITYLRGEVTALALKAPEEKTLLREYSYQVLYEFFVLQLGFARFFSLLCLLNKLEIQSLA